MFLDRRQPANAPIIGEGLVFRRNQTNDFTLAKLFEHVETNMAVEQMKDGRVLAIAAPTDGTSFFWPDTLMKCCRL